jgi:hypothetical protein
MDDIVQWVACAPAAEDLAAEGAMMNAACEAMGRALYLLRAALSVVATDGAAERGVSKHRAVYVGHMVRLCKLFDAFYMHTAKNQLEIAGVMSRLIFETAIRLSYLIEKGRRASVASYILASYRAKKDCLADLNAKAATRKLTAIEKRIRASILRSLRSDGIREADLMSNKVWDMDGKSTRHMLQALGREWQYGYGFAMNSRWVHGDWMELKLYELEKRGRYYMPSPDWSAIDARMAGPITVLCLDAAARYLKWSRGDPEGAIRRVIAALMQWLSAVDSEHERRHVAANGI